MQIEQRKLQSGIPSVAAGAQHRRGCRRVGFCVGMLFVLGLSLFAETTIAQMFRGFGGQDSVEIRKTARQIIESPEFRRLRRSHARGTSSGGSPGTGGSGNSGGQSSSGDGNGAERGQQPRKNSNSDDNGSAPDRQQDRSDFFSGSSTISSPLGEAVGGLFRLIAWIFLAVLCGVILFLIVKAIQNYERSSRPEDDEKLDGTAADDIAPERAPGETPADVYAARAKELAAGGRYREAIAQLLLGAMSHLERAEMIRFRQGLTLRDYLRAARQEQQRYTALKSMVRVYEPLGFGRRRANQQLFERTLSGYETGFDGIA